MRSDDPVVMLHDSVEARTAASRTPPAAARLPHVFCPEPVARQTAHLSEITWYRVEAGRGVRKRDDGTTTDPPHPTPL